MSAIAPRTLGAEPQVPARTGPARDVIRYFVLFALAAAAFLNFYRLSQTPDAPFASDWLWYQDGLHRLLSGGPIYAPELLAGPYHQLTAGFQYSYSLAPSLLPALVPLALVPAALVASVWSLLMAASVLAAFALVWPERGSRASSLLLALLLAILPPVLFGVWWANISCVVALGTALVIVGDRRGDRRLIVLGLVLAGMAKVLPAVPLAAWLLWRRREWRPVLASMAVGALLCLPAVVLQGPHVIVDFLTVMGNSQQETTTFGNVAPTLMLGPTIGANAATLVTFAAAALLVGFAIWRRIGDSAALLCLILASCAFVPNLWVHWLIAPMVVAVWWLGERIVAHLDVVMAPVAPARRSSALVEPTP